MTTTPLTATLVGGPTLRLAYAGRTFLTDPTFDEPRDYPGGITLHKLTGPAVPVEQVGPVDVVLLSHDQHADNLDEAGRALLPRVPVVLSTPLAASRLPGVIGLEPWSHTDLPAAEGLPGVRVTAVPAQHGPVGCEPLSGPVTGFVLQADAHPTVYVSGDNASVDVVQQVADRFADIRLALLFAGAADVGRFPGHPVTLDAVRALAAAEVLAGALLVPVHTEGWAHFTQTADDLRRAFAGSPAEARLRVLTRGAQTVLEV